MRFSALRYRSFVLRAFGFATIAVIVLAVLSDRWVMRSSRDYLFGDVALCPAADVALVLGCAPEVAGGRPNLYFTSRMRAAAELYGAGKCRYLLVSGDNGRAEYDEPSSMRTALIELGVPESAIVRDYAGFDTLDSILRARDVFGQARIIVVSQAFHNERAITIARRHGMEAYGLNAQAVGGPHAWKTNLREKIARVKTLADLHLLRSHPKFLGPTVPIGTAKG